MSGPSKATRHADGLITDGLDSSDEEECRHLAVGSDLVLLPTAPLARAVERTVGLAKLLRQVGVALTELLVRVDVRQRRVAGLPADQSVAQETQGQISKPLFAVNRINAFLPLSA